MCAACTASRGVVITRSSTNATVSVDAEQVPTQSDARAATLQDLAVKACGGADARVTSERLSTREDVQLDVDRVWASLQKRGEPTPWATSGASAQVTTPASSSDERSVRVQIPVWELSIECGG
jgi:hypothetical protein